MNSIMYFFVRIISIVTTTMTSPSSPSPSSSLHH
jgi:hypothetical protein